VKATSLLFNAPAAHRDNLAKLADFVELCALRAADGNVSSLDIVRILSKGGDDDSERQGVDSGTQCESIVEDVFQDLDERSKHCGMNNYPFELNRQGTLLGRKRLVRRHYLYHFLLLATRLDMRSNRTHAGEDGAVLFEELSKEVLMRFLGFPDPRVRGLVHGTGRYSERDDEDAPADNSFSVAVNHLCKVLKEGAGFTKRLPVAAKIKDDKLDVVAWREFSDSRCGRLIGFAQCKTGSNWKRDVGKLNPERFTAKWFVQQPAVLPLRLYFVSDRVCADWYELCSDGGLFFDRCRIMDYSDAVSPTLRTKIISWCKAVLKSEQVTKA
jgi:hypothetical protein